MNDVVGLIGVMVLLAGLHLLWQSRKEMLYWVEMYLGTFRSALRKRTVEGPARERVEGKRTQRERYTLRLVGGFGLVFLSQILLILEFIF